MSLKEEYTSSKWNVHSSAYHRVSRVTQVPADRLITLTNTLLPYTSPNSYILDSGAGDGSLTKLLSQRFPTLPILATDISSSMLSMISAAKLPNVSTRIVDATKAGELDEKSFSHVLSTFMIQFLPNPQGVVDEMCRLLRPGGVLGLGIWDRNNDILNAWARACKMLDPEYEVPKAHDPEAWYTVEELEEALRRTGLSGVRSEVVKVHFEWERTEDFIKFLFEGGNPSFVSLINAWTGDLGDMKRELTRIIRDEHDDGRAIFINTLLAVGKK